jgi:cytoskeletal protein RodZ
MTMQYDVKSYHVTTSKTVTSSAVRLKSITVSPATASLRSSAVADPTVFKTGTYARLAASTTVTVTITAHGLETGDRVFMDFTTGTAVDGVYAITKTNANVFTVTTAANTETSGAITFYSSILLEVNTYNIVGLPILVPGEGIYCKNGMFVGVGGSVTATVFYG